MKCWAGWSTNWNQDCQEKYQYPQISRWHHPYGRKRRRTKKPLEESERREWKSWLKAQHSENEDHGIWSHHFMTGGETMETVTGFIFLWGSKITADGDCCHEIKRRLLFGRKVMTNLDSLLKSRDITVPTKVRLVKTMFFSSSHVWMWELDYKEGWLLRNWCFWTVLLEKTLEGILDWKEIQPVHPKRNQSWISFRRTDAEAGAPILWPPDAKNWLLGKDPDAGKDGRRGEKGTTEDEMVGWHHWLDGHEFE